VRIRTGDAVRLRILGIEVSRSGIACVGGINEEGLGLLKSV
jgi:DNA-directed RNA polymerase subunit E'/Rpb7